MYVLVRRLDSGLQMPGFQPPSLAVQLWLNVPVCLSLLVYKMGIITVNYLVGWFWRLNENTHKRLRSVWHSGHSVNVSAVSLFIFVLLKMRHVCRGSDRDEDDGLDLGDADDETENKGPC